MDVYGHNIDIETLSTQLHFAALTQKMKEQCFVVFWFEKLLQENILWVGYGIETTLKQVKKNYLCYFF